jgi:hypothetical protein
LIGIAYLLFKGACLVWAWNTFSTLWARAVAIFFILMPILFAGIVIEINKWIRARIARHFGIGFRIADGPFSVDLERSDT